MADDQGQQRDATTAPVVEHLEELRRRIIWSLLALMVAVAVGWVFAPDIYDFLTQQFLRLSRGYAGKVQFSAFGITEIFMLQFRLGAYAGFVLAAPFILYQVLAFVLPALTPSEKRLVWGLLPATLLLFVAGVLFGYLVVVPLSLRFFITVTLAANVNLIFTAKQYIDLVMGICLPLGLAFELPVVVWLLATLGVVTAAFLRRIWKYMVVVIFVLAAFISPGSSVVDQIVMAVPLLGLYEISIWVAGFAERRRRRQASGG